ncbi:non-ribosomal peptide synthetase [Oceanirhabdus sp. W0125-5]|uniref:non-ribosomal peptide synthetase n=1 Tax=Oceanirhabdus sp. W0125-5 TaxID=2999116 RepID=UPI0022F31040|nr:non-ribosomal peptide synthetase [Oceanirhabdus sp. W0125-5]WBW95743.1 amino acid adenylation domain-containing protein [Oceanirhabdus sp. W0125-5]
MKQDRKSTNMNEKVLESRQYWESIDFDNDNKNGLKYDFFSADEYIKNIVSFSIDNTLNQRLKLISKKNDLLEFIIFAAGLNIELYKYTGKEETIIGIPIYIANKKDIDIIKNKVLPLKSSLNKETKLKSLMKGLQENIVQAYENQYYSIENILRNSKICDHVMEITPICIVSNRLHSSEYIDYICNSNKNEITICIDKKDNDAIDISFIYNSKLFERETIELFGQNYFKIISQIVNKLDERVKDIEMLTEVEKEQILYEFNNTKLDYNKEKTIQVIFEEQVEDTPNNIAAVFEGKQLTYRELNEKANQLGRVLRKKGIGSGCIVGILVERSLDMIVGIMGILKAGAAYLPLDSNLPKGRIEYMLKDAEVNILVTTENYNNEFKHIVNIVDILNEKIYIEDNSNLSIINKYNDLAYVIYTSGSTGEPKGVMIEHRSVNNLVVALNERIYSMYYSGLKVALLSPYYFDASVKQIFGALFNGNTLFIAPEEVRTSGQKIVEYYIDNKIEISDGTPMHMNMISNYINKECNLHIKHFVIGGDTLSPKIVKNIFTNLKYNTVKISNVYGPTECCVDSTMYLIDYQNVNNLDYIPIGKPICNTSIYILDNDNKIVPVGVQGELCISGDGLARGYLNRPDLTARKFVENPYEKGQRMYKTGDLARWSSDGSIEFIGRIDNQVKIRGFRIELGEIENRLLQHEYVNEAVVLVKENKENEKYLCAYVVSEKEISQLILKNYLKGSLPEYMVPVHYVYLEKMPITTNGKLNRKALPEPTFDVNLNEYQAPRNQIEEKMVEIWREVLGFKKVGINDNFFDLGGHSLKATVVISKIHKELNVEVPLKELFKSPTIKEISKYVENSSKNSYSSIENVEEKEYYKASSAQKRLYALQQFEKKSTAYNMPAIYELEGKIDKEKIENTFKKLVERHEALRTYFDTIDGEIVQKIDNEYEFKILIKREDQEELESIIKSFRRSFELEKAPLFRAELIESNEKNYLLIDMHHIISDGISRSILIKEFVSLYNGVVLEPLKIQYKDFAEWQSRFLKSEEMKKQEEYWINRFDDEVPVLNMPCDFERPIIQSFEGNYISFFVDEEITKGLRKIAKESGSTMHMVLMSGMYILLSKYSRQEDIVVGTPIGGRPHADLQNIMGMFVNTLALRNTPSGEKTYIDFLKEVKENSLKAYENQSYQFEELIEKLNVRRDMSRNPLFDVMFNMTNIDYGKNLKLDNLVLKPIMDERKVSKFDLTLTAIENDEIINFSLQYCSKLFKEETIQRMGEHYKEILNSICKNSNSKLSDIEVITEKEKSQILNKFNDTNTDYPKEKTIIELFEDQVLKTPDNIAASFEDKQITYKELNEKANQLARVLRDNGAKVNSTIALMTEQSIEIIIGIMGILKSGAAYVPIDPKFPKDRIEYMLRDAEVDLLVTSNKHVKGLAFNGHIIDVKNENIFRGDNSNLNVINKHNDLAYVIYTSGTTGKAKGVMIKHSNLVNYCTSIIKKASLTIKDETALLSSYAFDLGYTALYTALVTGIKLNILSEENYRDPVKLIEYLKKDITYIKITPSMFNMIVNCKDTKKLFDDSCKLRLIILGGESIHIKDIEKFMLLSDRNKIQFMNHYGPTESTIGCIATMIDAKRLNDFKNIIGKPLNNIKAYVLDKDNNLSAVGIPGELCIAGEGLGKGYLNRSNLTQQKFIKNPFLSNQLMYKTGDLARWSSEGNIEFLGRIDNQVKIRGFRIELGEIENRLLHHEYVDEAVVQVKDKGENDKYLCAYVVSDKELSELNLKNYLKDGLPEYMIPSYYVLLEKIPLTSNGKLNSKALPEPNYDVSLNEYEAPRNKIEEKIGEIWSEVLGINKIGINDNFFDLGGHSLKATVVIGKIHKELDAELPLKELFKSPTIKEIGEYIANGRKNFYSTIEKAEGKEYYEVSSVQKRLYTLQQLEKESTAYNMPVVYELEGKIDKEKIENTFKKLIERHEALRTCFETIDGEIVQKINSECEFNLLIRKEDEIEDAIANFRKIFNLEDAPLFRAEIIESKGKNYLLIDMHHIISDGISRSILIKEFVSLYNGSDLKPLRIQYKDFAEWQNKFLKSQEIKKQEEYWTKRFNDEIPVLDMPYDYERPLIQNFEGDNISFLVDEEITRGLRKIAKESGSTMHMVLMSAFTILLSKYSRQEDIIVGTPVGGRPHADIQNIMGMFVNTLALRNYPSGEKTYSEFLKEVKENSLNAYENQSYQFEELIEKVNVRRNLSRNPLFDVMFNMTNIDYGKDLELDGLVLKQFITGQNISKVDLTLKAMEDYDTVRLDFEYCTKLFKEDTIRRMGKHYIKILKSICKNCDIKLSEVEIITEKEKNQILYDFNNTKIDYPRDKKIQELFEEQVEKTPENIAVIFKDTKFTYRELNEKANQLARVIGKNGVQAENIIGIMVERSIEMIVSILGVLKSGGAYLPIDPASPIERIEYMLKDSDCKLLLTKKQFSKSIDFEGDVLHVSDNEIYKGDTSNLTINNNCKNLAYIIYTSGTTGNPKGVLIEHKNIRNTLLWRKEYYKFDSNDAILQIPSFSFDSSVEDIMTPLISGSKLVLVNEEKRLDIEYLKRTIIRNNVSNFLITPAFYSTLLEECLNEVTSLRKITVAGESIHEDVVSKHFKTLSNTKLYNEYGPTENSVCSTIHEFNECSNKVLIGKPISNTKVLILDSKNKIVPIGIPGELCVSGEGVARGYLNRPELTNKKFIENPFEQGERMYKTGDLARWLPDGNIEFIGRVDNQVKIRGYRIELGEIENRLLSHKNINQAVVLARGTDNNEKYLCAYVNCKEEIDNSLLRDYLKESLPEYMVPSYFIQIDELPLTVNGKINTKALPKPDINERMITKYIAPTNEIEEKLVELWCQILGVDKIGINDNFFDLGGHSLKAIVLINKIHKELNVQIPLKELFKNSTIKEISEYIENSSENLYKTIEKAVEKEYYETSSAQKRLYTLQQFEKDSTAYNMPVMFELEGKIDKERIDNAFKKLVARHEALRTYFHSSEGEIIQKIDAEYEFKLKNRSVDIKEPENIIKSFLKAFELEKAPLFRAEIVESLGKHYLLIDMHHIISDGMSMSLLIKEFVSLYNGINLKPLRIQYKDFSEWQNKFLKSDEMKKQEEYWINRFKDEVPVLNMPYDYERPIMKSFEGDSIRFQIDEETTKGLKKIAKESGSTMHMVLLSTMYVLFSKYSSQEDIVIGTPIGGRTHADLQNIIGMFVNTLALRNKPSRKKTYINFLKEVKENSLKAYENQSYQFEQLIDKLQVRRDTSRNPLFDVMFNMTNISYGKKLDLDGLLLKPQNVKSKISKFDITINAVVEEKTVRFTFEYCTKLFKEESIRRMSKHFIEILKSICKNPQAKLSEIQMLTNKEKKEILYNFNDTRSVYPKDKTIHELFEDNVEKTPNNIALVFKDKKLTYSELNEKSNQLARLLRSKGVQANSIVGIMVERSVEMIIGIMGILKAGAAYLPIDPKHPKERIEYTINDAKVEILVTTNEFAEVLKFEGTIIDITDGGIFKGNRNNLEKISKNNDLAYVIYTSGSTGKPKGVMIEHRQVNNFAHGISKEINLTEYKSILCITTISFDIFGLETLVPLTQGLKVVVASEEQHNDGDNLSNIIEQNNVEIMQSTPSRLKLLLASSKFQKTLKGMKVILVGGEELPINLLNDLKAYENLKAYNVYGPTETTIWSTVKLLKNQQKITIGKPISNTDIYIVDGNNEIVPVGVHGELCIAGDGVARGYLNRPELTSEKFVNNPYRLEEIMYKTGDLARWLPDGEIEFLGRIDNQVKIRGFRIELGEIENRLTSHDNIKEAVVLARSNKNEEKYLCAYLVCNNSFDAVELRNYLKQDLPEYMIPAHFIKMDEIPLNSNGKVDKKALCNVKITNYSKKSILPRSLHENVIAEIWKGVLGLNEIYVHDDFFELGGNSINIIQVANEIKNRLEIEITPANLMVHKTIADLSEFIIQRGVNGERSNHIFKINNSTSNKKIFIVHGGDGDIFYYRHLAKLLEENYSVYGIQPKGLNGSEPLPESYYEMTTDYIREIREIQNEGPYIIAGFCIGTYLAYDIVSILEMQGEEVSALIEIDQEAFVEKKIHIIIDILRGVLNTVDFWRRITNKDKNYTIKRFTDLIGKKHRISKERQMDIISDRKKILKFFCEELMPKCRYCYLAKRVKTPTLVVKASKTEHHLFNKESWSKMTGEVLEYQEIQGNHSTILLPPYVDKLGETILEFLDKK